MQKLMNLVQLRHPQNGRRIAVVEATQLRFLKGASSMFDFAMAATR
jgi:hypothetical protein